MSDRNFLLTVIGVNTESKLIYIAQYSEVFGGEIVKLDVLLICALIFGI